MKAWNRICVYEVTWGGTSLVVQWLRLCSQCWGPRFDGSVVKNLPAHAVNAWDSGSVPGLEKSPGGGNGKPFQYSGLEKSHGQRSLAGYSPWTWKDWDITEQLSMHGTRSHMLQLRVRRPQLKILHATAKTWNSQIKKLKLNIKKKKLLDGDRWHREPVSSDLLHDIWDWLERPNESSREKEVGFI